MKPENPTLQVIDLLLIQTVLPVLISTPKTGESVGHSQMYLSMGLVAVPPLLPHTQSCLSSNCPQPLLLMLLQYGVICQGGFGCILIRKGFIVCVCGGGGGPNYWSSQTKAQTTSSFWDLRERKDLTVSTSPQPMPL